MKLRLLSILLLFALKSHAQTFRAVVCDSFTKQPLPSASIRVKDTNLGTTTNNDGKFSLSVKKGTFAISYIGYMSKSISSSALPDTVFLAESNQLNEVVVMPDSALRVLLRNAYNNISKNYPQQPTYLNGFYREIYENQSENTFNYFSENFLKIYKPAYTIAGKYHEGQIKVLKSRTIKNPEYVQKGTKYMGGPFLPIAKDLVLKKNWAINPDYFNKFYFELEKITYYDEKQVYVINSTLRDSSGTTKLYINKEDLAYIKIETFNKSKDRGGEYKRIGETSTILYEQKEDIWFLKYLKYSIDGDKKDEIINHLAEFVATNFETENIKPFSYNEQLLKTDIIADQKSDISDNFFEGQEGIIEQSNALKNQVQLAFKLNVLDSLKNTSSSSSIEKSSIKTKEETAQYKQRQGFDFRTFLLRANLFFPNFGFVYTPIHTYNATFSTTLANTFEKSKSFSATTRSNFVPILYNSKYWTFSLNKRFILQYSKNNTIRNTVYVNQRDIGLAYRIVLNKTTKPIFIEPNIKYLSTCQNFEKSYTICNMGLPRHIKTNSIGSWRIKIQLLIYNYKNIYRGIKPV